MSEVFIDGVFVPLRDPEGESLRDRSRCEKQLPPNAMNRPRAAEDCTFTAPSVR